MPNPVTIYSPYEKLHDFWAKSNVSDVLSNLRDYLLLLPCKECPNPIVTNDNPRARLVKYLYYDEPNPLDLELPSVEERLKIVFNPGAPDAPPDRRKGYRFFTQSAVAQGQNDGQQTLRMFIGRGVPDGPYSVTYAVSFQILSNYATESNTSETAISRAFAMELAIIEALNGVNITGVGTFMYDRMAHADCGSRPISDDQQNVGRILTMCFQSMGGNPNADPINNFRFC